MASLQEAIDLYVAHVATGEASRDEIQAKVLDGRVKEDQAALIQVKQSVEANKLQVEARLLYLDAEQDHCDWQRALAEARQVVLEAAELEKGKDVVVVWEDALVIVDGKEIKPKG